MNLAEVYNFASQVADQMIAEKEEVTRFCSSKSQVVHFVKKSSCNSAGTQ